MSAQLKWVPHLAELNLIGNFIGCKGAKALSAQLHCVSQLTELYLNRNYIGCEGIIALGAQLKSIPHLVQLYLWENDNIGCKGGKIFCANLRYVPKLAGMGMIIEDYKDRDMAYKEIAETLAKTLPDTKLTISSISWLANQVIH